MTWFCRCSRAALSAETWLRVHFSLLMRNCADVAGLQPSYGDSVSRVWREVVNVQKVFPGGEWLVGKSPLECSPKCKMLTGKRLGSRRRQRSMDHLSAHGTRSSRIHCLFLWTDRQQAHLTKELHSHRYSAPYIKPSTKRWCRKNVRNSGMLVLKMFPEIVKTNCSCCLKSSQAGWGLTRF